MSDDIEDIGFLPSIGEMKKRSQALALLDAIIMPDWEYRYFSFNNNWDGKSKEAMASMRDGSGGEYFFHFTDDGVVGKVLDNTELSDTLSALKKLPNCFDSFKSEEAFNNASATFFCWCTYSENDWSAFPKGLAKYPLMNFIVSGSSAYQSWAEEYYETTLNGDVLESVFTSLKVTPDQLFVLNSEITLDDLFDDIQEIIGG